MWHGINQQNPFTKKIYCQQGFCNSEQPVQIETFGKLINDDTGIQFTAIKAHQCSAQNL